VEIIHAVLEPIIKEKRSRRSRKRNSIISVLLFCFILILLVSINEIYKLYFNARVNRLTAESLVVLYQDQDNTKAIRIGGAAFELKKDNPPARTCKVLTDIGYSSIEKPFYTTVLNHKNTIYTAYFSPDGNSILTASEDGTAKLWDLEGNLKADLIKHTARVLSAVFSQDGNRILTASWDRTAILWDKNGGFIAVLKHDGIVE
jgi:WD40 repeat protein